MSDCVKILQLSVSDFNPKLLKFTLFNGLSRPQGYRYELRHVYDYELEYIIESRGGSVVIDDSRFEMRTGDVFFKKPGQTLEAVAPYKSYLIVFDLRGDTEKDPEKYYINTEKVFQPLYKNSIIDAVPQVYHPSDPQKYHNLFKKVFNYYIMHTEASQLAIKASLLYLIYELHSDACNSFTDIAVSPSPYFFKIKRVIDYINTNYRDKLNLEIMAEISGLSPCYFHKLFKKAVKMKPNDYVREVRLKNAKDLLAKTDIPIYEVALKCGFENIPYFSYIFGKRFGMSPNEFRQKHR